MSKFGSVPCSLTHPSMSESIRFLTSGWVFCSFRISSISTSNLQQSHPVVDDPRKGSGKRLAADLAVQRCAAVAHESVGELRTGSAKNASKKEGTYGKGEELDVGAPVGEALLQGSDAVACAVRGTDGQRPARGTLRATRRSKRPLRKQRRGATSTPRKRRLKSSSLGKEVHQTSRGRPQLS